MNSVAKNAELARAWQVIGSGFMAWLLPTLRLRLEPTTKSATKLQLEELEGRLELAEVVAEQLAEELKTSGEQHAKQLNELQEQVAHHAKHLEELLVMYMSNRPSDKVAEVGGWVGKLTDRLDKTIKVINGNKQVYDGMFEKSQNGSTMLRVGWLAMAMMT